MNIDHFTATTFRKASGSGDTGCVEVAFSDNTTGIRDSKCHDGNVLCFATPQWDALLDAIKNSELDFLA